MPTVASASTMVSGLSALVFVACWRFWTFGPSESALTPGASNRTVTWVGALTWPGTTSANSSSRLCGFCTMPVTVFGFVLPWCHTLPTRRPKAEATPLVTATWFASVG